MTAVLLLHVFMVAVLALMVGMVCRWGRFRPAVCHALWLIVLIKLFIPPVIGWPASLQEMVPGASRVFIAMEQAQTPDPAAMIQPSVPLEEKARPALPAYAASPARAGHYAPMLLAAIWIMGCLFTLGLHIYRIRRFLVLIKQASPAPDWLQQCTDKLSAKFGVHPPTVMVGTGFVPAFVWNPWRSKILVSCDLIDTLRGDEWNGIISHELAHLKRRDLWVGWLELAAVCLWWWNPLLILVRRRLHLYAELACDAWVLWALPENGNQYAEVLFRIINLESRQQTPVPAFGMAAGTAAAFKMRLALLLQGSAGCRMSRKAIAAATVLLIGVVPSLTPSATEAYCTPAPLTFGDTAPPETTRDAAAVLEMRIYLVRDKMKCLGNDFGQRDAKCMENTTFAIKRVLTHIDPSQIIAGGLPVTMEGATLLWNGQDEPESPKVTHVASPAVALRPNDTVSVSVALPAQAIQWLKSETALQVSYSCVPENDDLRFWFTLSPPADFDPAPGIGNFPSSMSWTNILVPTPQNQWGCLAAGLYKENKERATLLMFWKRRPCDPAQPEQKLPGPTHGEFLVKHAKQDEKAEYDPRYCFTAEMKVTEAAAADIENLVTGLPSVTHAATSPANLRMYSISGKDELNTIFEKLSQSRDAELITAPRVTFRTDNQNTGVPRNPDKTKPSHGELLQDFSQSLSSFFAEAHPRVIVADYATTSYPSDDDNKLQNVSEGTALAIATEGDVHDNLLDIHFFYNVNHLIHRYRGHLFWKKEILPEIVETAVDVKMPYPLGQGLCFITPSLEPEKRCLIFFSLDRAEPPDAQTQKASPAI